MDEGTRILELPDVWPIVKQIADDHFTQEGLRIEDDWLMDNEGRLLHLNGVRDWHNLVILAVLKLRDYRNFVKPPKISQCWGCTLEFENLVGLYCDGCIEAGYKPASGVVDKLFLLSKKNGNKQSTDFKKVTGKAIP